MTIFDKVDCIGILPAITAAMVHSVIDKPAERWLYILSTTLLSSRTADIIWLYPWKHQNIIQKAKPEKFLFNDLLSCLSVSHGHCNMKISWDYFGKCEVSISTKLDMSTTFPQCNLDQNSPKNLVKRLYRWYSLAYINERVVSWKYQNNALWHTL